MGMNVPLIVLLVGSVTFMKWSFGDEPVHLIVDASRNCSNTIWYWFNDNLLGGSKKLQESDSNRVI